MPSFKAGKILKKFSLKNKRPNLTSTLATDAINDQIIQITANNENLPPDSNMQGLSKKKYVINKKRSAQESFDRLKKHVPTLDGKADVSQLDVLLEAIQYIQSLRKDLGKDSEEDQALQHQLQLLRDNV